MHLTRQAGWRRSPGGETVKFTLVFSAEELRAAEAAGPNEKALLAQLQEHCDFSDTVAGTLFSLALLARRVERGNHA